MKGIFKERLVFLLIGVMAGCAISPLLSGAFRSSSPAHADGFVSAPLLVADQIRARSAPLRRSETGSLLSSWMNDVAQGPMRLEKTEERLRLWTAQDPEGALAWATARVIPSERTHMIEVVFKAWGGFSVQHALVKATDMAGEIRQCAVRAAMKGFVEVDPKSALVVLAGLENQGIKQDIQDELVLEIIHKDPVAAMEYAEKAGGALRSAALSAWQESDPQAALSWVQLLPDSPEKQGSLLQMAAVWVATAPESACEYAIRLSDPDNKAAFCSTVAAALLQQNRSKAMAWVASISDESAHTAAADSLCNALAAQDPPAAADYAANLANQTQNTQPLMSAVGAWASTDAAAAGAWVAAFPEGQLKEQAISSLADSAVSQSPEAFGSWLDGAIPASLRDAVIAQVINKSRAGSSAWAADWALRMGDSDSRWQSLSGVVRKWKGLDPSAAEAWIAQTQLPLEWREELKSLISKD